MNEKGKHDKEPHYRGIERVPSAEKGKIESQNKKDEILSIIPEVADV
jgi:hypothetical protein